MAAPAPSADGPELRERKKAARREARALRRSALDRLGRAGIDNGAAIAANAFADLAIPAGAVVAAYWPMPGEEADVTPLLQRLYATGRRCCLPVVTGKGQPLSFRAWTPDTELVEGTFSVPVPPETAPECTPQVLFCPLLAVDRHGFRLGFGGGFYDRTLAQLRGRDPQTRAYGVALSDQVFDAVPRDAQDARLDAIVTEAGVTWPEPA